MGVPYSKKRLMAQDRVPTMTSKKMKEGTVLTIVDVLRGTYTNDQDVEVVNDVLLLNDQEGNQHKLPVKEFNKMIFKTGDSHEGEAGSDEIELPDAFKILSSEDRKGDGEEQPRYVTYAYKGGAAFVKARGKGLDYIKDVIESGLKEPNHFDPLQNYTVAVVE